MSGAWVAQSFATTAADPGSARSVREAKQLPGWDGPGGFREAVVAEIDRVMTYYRAAEYVPMSEYYRAIDKHGANRVVLQNIVFPLKTKRNTAGKVTRRKGRWTIADLRSRYQLEDTYSANIAPASQRILSQLLVKFPGSKAYTSDIGGAYFNGKPPDPSEPGGRALFGRVPTGWKEFGFPQYNEKGEQMVFRIVGNMPGVQNAGRVWSDKYTADLLAWGFQQSVVDRRLFYQFDDEGKALIVGVFVDDNWILSQSPSLYAKFQENWSTVYEGAPDMSDTEGEFCGVGSVRIDDETVELHVDKAIDDLADKLSAHPLPALMHCDVPMAIGGFHAIAEAPSDASPLMSDALLSEARYIMGLGGWIVFTLRAYNSFASTVLATQLGKNFTRKVWHAVLRWAHYLATTLDGGRRELEEDN